MILMGATRGSLKKSYAGFHPPETVEGLFLAGSRKTEESFNEGRAQDDKDRGLCALAQSGRGG